MKKYRARMSNAVSTAKWNKATPSTKPNGTTNSVITPAMFKRECIEYDAGVLPVEHELYIGERYA